jgi:hypothetical protein
MNISSFCTLLLLSFSLAEGYVTYKTHIPATRQVQWLSKLTSDICESQPGSDLIEAVPEVMKGWSTSKEVTAENAVAVESLVKRLVDEGKAGNLEANPTTADYNVMLRLWERSRGGGFAAERCEQILMKMQELYESGDSNVQPNVESFKSVLRTWRISGVSFNSLRAQRLLEYMIRLYSDGKNDLVLPDSDCFDIVLQIWSRSSYTKAPKQAEKLIGIMGQLADETESNRLRPTTRSFNAVLSTWARSLNQSKDWNRLCEILAFMEKLYYVEGNERVEPDRCTYNIVLCALAKKFDSKTASKADTILRSLEGKYKSGKLSWEPDAILFNAVTGCWAHSDTSGAYRKARSILDRQLILYKNNGCQACKPDVIGFTSVLSCCASEPDGRERQKAFYVALATFLQLENRSDELGSPNHVTYGTMLKACARLLPNGSAERRKWTKFFFEKCSASGMVGGMVLSRVREAATTKDYKELMQGHTKRSLPDAWTRKVQERSEYRRNSSLYKIRRSASK